MVFIILVGTGIIILGLVGTFVLQTQRDIYGKALSLAAMGNFVDSRAIIRDKLDGSPGDTRAHMVLAKIYSMESDFLNEAKHLERILEIGKFEKDMNPVQISNRIADIYYSKDMNEEAFFQYLTTVENEHANPTACIRLGFMALGQKEFNIANTFLSRLNADKVKFAAYFTARGVVEGSLNKGTELEWLEKSYKMEPLPVSGFLYAIALAKKGKNDKAIELADELIDKIDDEYIRFTLYQFIMAVNIKRNNMIEATKFARLCNESARLAGWNSELIESDIHYSMLCVLQGKYEEASEFLIEAEANRVHEIDIIALANLKYKLENDQGNLEVLRDVYDVETEVKKLFTVLFPNSRYFELSGMRTSKLMNIKGMVDEGGKKIIKKLDHAGVDKFEKFLSLQGTTFKNACVRIMLLMNYRVSREIPNPEKDGVNYIAMNKENKDIMGLFRFRKWRDSKISDVFLREMLSELERLNMQKGFLVGNFELTEGGKKYASEYPEKLHFINGNEFDNLLAQVIE